MTVHRCEVAPGEAVELQYVPGPPHGIDTGPGSGHVFVWVRVGEEQWRPTRIRSIRRAVATLTAAKSAAEALALLEAV